MNIRQRFPPTILIGSCLMGIIILYFFSFGLSYIIIFGLLLEIVGVFILAIPDWPRIYATFPTGRLESGKNTLNERHGSGITKGGVGELQEGESGFKEMIDSLYEAEGNEWQRGEQANPISWEGIKRLNINTEHPGIDSSWSSRHQEQYALLELQDEDRETLISMWFGTANAIFEKEIRSGESRIRRGGLLLIGTGFILILIGELHNVL
ncbi:hypothetical protein [Natrialba sp. SSL1]|uniref:hypothetical protein n=1 Tax=Natrialba sp. SSL1 TaxID=1869245 RepID=UPI0011135BEE|nr:hypothetical protein [Natrialba sp. SSL1]